MQSNIDVGDYVMVRVGRDRERGGDVVFKSECGYFLTVNFDCTEDSRVYHIDLVRKLEASKELDYSKAVKHDKEKNRVELIPSSGIEGIGRAMTFGASKYADHNWAKGFKYSRLIGSALRHLLAYNRGEDKDPESGLSHLDHAGACLVMLIAHENEKLGTDDRRKNAN